MPRQTVLEIVKHEKDDRTYYVASGYGEKSDWYLDVAKIPNIILQVRNEVHQAIAKRIQPEAAEQIILEYGRRHPTALREFTRFMGYRIEKRSGLPFSGSLGAHPCTAPQRRKSRGSLTPSY